MIVALGLLISLSSGVDRLEVMKVERTGLLAEERERERERERGSRMRERERERERERDEWSDEGKKKNTRRGG